MAVRASPGPAGSGQAPLRVTCFALPIVGHMTPLLPVLGALVGRGGAVEVVSGAAHVEPFTKVGATVSAVYPEAFTLAIQRPSHNFLEVAALLANWTERALLTLARRVVRETAPDVVIVDSMAPWGRLAAQEHGIPVVTSTSSFLIDAVLGASPRAAADVLRRAGTATGSLAAIRGSRRRLRRHEGVDCGGPLCLLANRGAATIVYTSRSLQPGGERFGKDVHFVGPTAAERPTPPTPIGSPLRAALAVARDSEGARPLAHVGLGTIYNRRPRFLREAALALAASGYRVTVDVGQEIRMEELGSLPDEVLCVRDAPQLAILDRASLFVTHGGMNSVHEALWRSVPMVVFPQAADQPIVAARLQALGAARVLRGREPSAAAIT